MKKKGLQKKWLFLGVMLLLIWLPTKNIAQSVKRQCISSYGSSVYSDNTTIEQTAGQSYFTTGKTEDNSTILQGFHQPNTFRIEEISNYSLKNLNISVFPNPASYSITIKSDIEISQSDIRVVDINGKSIISERVNNLQSHIINCETWENGIYLITILDSENNSKTLRLIISK